MEKNIPILTILVISVLSFEQEFDSKMSLQWDIIDDYIDFTFKVTPT